MKCLFGYCWYRKLIKVCILGFCKWCEVCSIYSLILLFSLFYSFSCFVFISVLVIDYGSSVVLVFVQVVFLIISSEDKCSIGCGVISNLFLCSGQRLLLWKVGIIIVGIVCVLFVCVCGIGKVGVVISVRLLCVKQWFIRLLFLLGLMWMYRLKCFFIRFICWFLVIILIFICGCVVWNKVISCFNVSCVNISGVVMCRWLCGVLLFLWVWVMVFVILCSGFLFCCKSNCLVLVMVRCCVLCFIRCMFSFFFSLVMCCDSVVLVWLVLWLVWLKLLCVVISWKFIRVLMFMVF